MINFNKNIICLLAVLLALASCSDEELINKKGYVQEGVPVTVNLGFSLHESTTVETKASDISNSAKINTLAILVFKEKNGVFEKEGETYFFEQPSSGKVSFKTTSGYKYIYGVANYESSLFSLKDDLEKITSLDDLKNLDIKLPDHNISILDDYYLMSGWFVADDNELKKTEACCIVGTDGKISAGKIDLKHIMASVSFNISGGNSVKFTADTWQVVNAPESSSLIEGENDCSGSYFNSKVNSTFKMENRSSATYSFSFLMMENRKEINEGVGAPSSVDERERMEDKVASFVYADKNSTYIVLKGTYEGKTSHEVVPGDTKEKDVKAYTTYYIHMGDWSKNDFTNFKIFRNTRYIYNATVIGIDKLLVEVLTDEQSWSSDAEMYLSSSNVTTFDAHYGTTVISFTKDEIKELADKCSSEADFVNSFEIKAATPKNSFVADEKDLDWVSYRRNERGVKSYAKYKDASDEYNAKLLDAVNFKKDLYYSLKDADAYDNEGKIYYTCFIDEYFYYTDADKKQPENFSFFINQSPRTIQISTDYYKNYNPSSESSISMAKYVFTQKSIWSIYDLSVDKLNAWGTESVMEGDPVASTPNIQSRNTDMLQGRENMVNVYNGKERWDDVLDFVNNEMKEGYNTSFYACLNRNRDLNGDGVINDDEIRWYLPALNQYMGFWMGVDVLPEEVRLFAGNRRIADENNDYIYLSSTYNNGIMVFWASAGSSTSSYREALSWSKKSAFPYRCVRNLSSIAGEVIDFLEPHGQLKDKAESFKEYEKNTYQSFSNDYLNPRALRSNVSSPLSKDHTHLVEENRLPKSFEVSPLMLTNTVEWENMELNPCSKLGKGWRLPNQREISIIAFHRKDGTSESYNLHSATKSGLLNENDNSLEDRRAYYMKGNVSLQPLKKSISANYRCVKDK